MQEDGAPTLAPELRRAPPAPRPRRPPTRGARAPATVPRDRGLRPEIQALRALAVALVVAFHVAPGTVPGGYVGVDVFFVVSGFLITGALVRERERTGTIRLLAFWARRVRRLLPAALLVIAVAAVGVLLLVPVSAWEPMLAELRAATLYVENRQLASAAVDYFAANEAASPVQHFWSLAVEEQFYVAWPLVLLALGAALRRRPELRRAGLPLAVAGLTAASFVWAVTQVASEPGAAYFGTAARAWEFGVGALLAVVPTLAVRAARRTPAVEGRIGMPGGSRSVPRRRFPVGAGAPTWAGGATWAGVAAIVLAAVVYGTATPFPGVAALLPALGAAAVIAGGMPSGLGGRVVGSRLLRWLGDRSYGVYLWHWPLLVLAPYALGDDLGPVGLTGVVALTLVLAWATYRWVEEPVRHGALTRRPPAWSLGAAAAGMLLVLAVTAIGEQRLDATLDAAQTRTKATLAERPACFGAASRDPERPCRNDALRTVVAPAPVEARGSQNAPCDIVERLRRLAVCRFGGGNAAAAGDGGGGDTVGGRGGTVALLGDSHAAHWRGAVEEVARVEGWRGVSLTYTGCPYSAANRDVRGGAQTRCTEFRREALAWFRRHPEVHTVFVAALSGGSGAVARPGEDPFRAAATGYANAWGRLPASIRHIVVLRDNPKAGKGSEACVQRAIDGRRDAGRACAIPRAEALDPDPAVSAARRVGAPRVQVVDLTSSFCDAQRCYPVVGGALVHRDQDHLTPVFAQSLGPLLRRALARLPFSVAPG